MAVSIGRVERRELSWQIGIGASGAALLAGLWRASLHLPHEVGQLSAKNWGWYQVVPHRSLFQGAKLDCLLDPLQSIDDLFARGAELGSGSGGQVWKVADLQGRAWALKEVLVPHEELLMQMAVQEGLEPLSFVQSYLERLGVRELEISAKLDHPNVVTIHHLVAKVDAMGRNHLFLVMEYLEEYTGSLSDLGPEVEARITGELLHSYQDMLNMGIIPDDCGINGMVTVDGHYKWYDLAHYMDVDRSETLGNTTFGEAVRELHLALSHIWERGEVQPGHRVFLDKLWEIQKRSRIRKEIVSANHIPFLSQLIQEALTIPIRCALR